MERSLRDLRRFNKYAGGTGVYRRLLRRLAPNKDERLTILDLGTGTSDLLESLGDRPNLLPIGLDLKIDHLLYLRHSSRVRRVVGDAMHLPFRDNAVDIVTSAHFFHHFTADENVSILRGCLRVARRGVIFNDTRRHYVPYLFVRGLALFRLVGRITRFDAPASILRGYTFDEAEEVANRVGAARTKVVHSFPYRFGILLWKMST
jgi:ubiquinone/menaquinone biosynthesis C-methylase UbiE